MFQFGSLSSIKYSRLVKKSCAVISILSFSFLMSWYALAMLSTQPPATKVPEEPTVIGNFTVALKVYDVDDLYAWQAVIAYNPNELKVLKIDPGDFVGVETLPLNYDEFKGDSVFVKNVFSDDGLIMVGGTMLGETHGRSGNGTLTYITFGYFNANYSDPYLSIDTCGFKTVLLDSNSSEIPIHGPTILVLEKVKK
jgi:hypothetical protein